MHNAWSSNQSIGNDSSCITFLEKGRFEMSTEDPKGFPTEDQPDLSQLIQMLMFDPIRRRIMEQQVRPLSAHLVEFKAALLSKKGTIRHVRDTVRRVRLMLRLCRVNAWHKLTPSGTQIAISRLMAVRGSRKTLGLATVNHYIHSLKAFANWMVSDYRAERSPFLSLKTFNTQTDVRRERRPLTKEEAINLVRVANNGATIAGIRGAERAMMYTLAMTTGLRAGELQSLTRSSFSLGAEPYVIVEAAYSKHRRRDTVPLRADVARLVRAYLAETTRDDKLFRRPSANGTRALRIDLEAAGIPYCLNGKYADFHSQRHTFVSNLFDSGATPKEAQTLARHQDPRLTLGRYAHAAADAQRRAVERLPSTETETRPTTP